MIENEYSPGNYKSLKVTIGSIIIDPEMLRFVPDHLKTKKICRYAVKKLVFVIRYVPDRYKTQEICDKVALENGGTLRCVPDCYKN